MSCAKCELPKGFPCRGCACGCHLIEKLAAGSCECLGWPPICNSCQAREALREQEKRK